MLYTCGAKGVSNVGRATAGTWATFGTHAGANGYVLTLFVMGFKEVRTTD